MSVQKFIILVATASIFSWIAWLTVVFYIDPTISGGIGLFVFYASLFFALIGSFTLLGLWWRVQLRRWRANAVVLFRLVPATIRQAVWFSTILIVCLMLLARDLFNWWSASLLLLGFGVLEAFFLASLGKQQDQHE